jgi:spore coat polysaccharide biosynthesis predicted glycosyltransferase SpsG
VGHGLGERVAVVVADGGPESGLGHVARSSALAVALGRLGVGVRCLALGADGPLQRDGVSWDPIARLDDVPLADASVLVLDSYRLGEGDVAGLPAAVPLVVLQEHLPPPSRAALIVSAGAEPDGDPRRLAGLEYVSLRPAFWSAPPRDIAERVRHILVTTGGGDPVPGLGAQLAAAAHDALPEAEVTLVRGPFGFPGPPPPGVELLDAPASLHGPLLATDLAVTAGGQTLLEAAALGTPSIAVVAAENQRQQALRLAELGAARVLELPADELAVLLRRLDASADERRELARRSQAAVDGRGAERVAGRIAALI